MIDKRKFCGIIFCTIVELSHYALMANVGGGEPLILITGQHHPVSDIFLFLELRL